LIFGQEGQEKVPLETILTNIEKQYSYKFNFIEETISDVSIKAPDPELSPKDCIEYLREETNLIFKLLESNFISIRKRNGLVLCGYLKDKDTQEPLPFATIQGIKKSSISDEDGYFELSIEEVEELITIRFIGYKTLNRSFKFFKRDVCGAIYMTEQLESLEQVILNNYLVEGITKINTGELEVDFSKFNILPGLIETDVLQSIQAFPGVQSINETVSNINIRGGTHDQNLILWDDIKMYQSGHFFGLISVFNPQITRKVSLQKNGTSADYSDGISGTIAMQTDERINQKFVGSIGSNLIDANTFFDIPLGKKSSLQIAGRKSINDLVNTPTYEVYFDRISQDTEIENNETSVINSDQQFSFYDTTLRWIYRPSDNDLLRVNFININNELIFTENATIENEMESRESTVSQNSIGGGVFYQRNWSDKFTSIIQVYETDYKLKAVNANLFESQRFLQENVVSETGARIKGSYRISDWMIIHSGYQFIETEVTNLDDVDVPLIRTLISEVVRTHSGFSQVDLRSNNRQTNISLGFRYNYLDKFKKHLYEPRVSIHQQFLRDFSIELAGEVKHQTTTQIINFQNDFLGIEKRRWQLANDNEIPVLLGRQGSIALSYSNKGWLLSAEGYYKKVEGITTQSQGFQNQYEFVKTRGNYDVFGFDLLLRKRFRNINLWLSYSFMDNQYSFQNLPENQFPSNLDITQALTFGSTYRFKGLKISAGLNWHTGKPTTRPIFNNEIINGAINYNATNSSRLDDYFRVDTSALYEFKLGKMTINAGVSVWNLLNQDNVINNYYRISEQNQVEEFTQSALGLTPNATLKVYF